MLMKIRVDSRFEGRTRADALARQVARFGQRFRNPGDHKDVKNTDRSHDVYENKGSYDTMAEKRSEIVSECARYSQICVSLVSTKRQNFWFLMEYSGLRMARGQSVAPRRKKRTSATGYRGPWFGVAMSCRYSARLNGSTHPPRWKMAATTNLVRPDGTVIFQTGIPEEKPQGRTGERPPLMRYAHFRTGRRLAPSRPGTRGNSGSGRSGRRFYAVQKTGLTMTLCPLLTKCPKLRSY